MHCFADSHNSAMSIPLLQTRRIEVDTAEETTPVMVETPLVRRSSSVRRPTMVSTFILVIICCLLLLSSSLVTGVTGARARVHLPHLLHVAVSPLALRSMRPRLAGSSALEQSDSLALVRMYFDRAIGTHSPDSLEHAQQLMTLTCAGAVVPLSQWVDGGSTAGGEDEHVRLVTPVQQWMDYFSSDDSLDEDSDDDNSSSPSLVLPSGHVGSGGSPFAANSFVALLVLPKESDWQALESCTVELRVDKIQVQQKGAQAAAKPSVLSVPLAPSSSAASAAAAASKLPPRQRPAVTSWSGLARTTRWILPEPRATIEARAAAMKDREGMDGAALEQACRTLRAEQRMVFLENGATSVEAIQGPLVSTMMQPTIDQFEQTSTIQTAQMLSKNYVSTLSGSIPPEVAKHVSDALAVSVPEIVGGLLTTSLTDSCSSSIAAALGAYLTRSVSEEVGEIVHDHVLGALTQLIPPDLSTRLTVSVTKKLPQQIIKDVTMSLTQTLTGSLTRGMSNFNHMQKMCRMCALYKYRCSDCKYVKDVQLKTTHYSGQYSHYYAGYYSEFYAPPASQLDVKGMTDEIINAGPAEGTRGIGPEIFGGGGGGGGGGGEGGGEGGEGGGEGGGGEGGDAGGEAPAEE